MEGFTNPYRYDGNDNEGDLLLYMREDNPSRLLQCKWQSNIESLFVEINLRKRKCLLSCLRNPHRNSISKHLKCLNRWWTWQTYDNFMFIGDFNVGIDENSMKKVCEINMFQKPWQTHMYWPYTHKSNTAVLLKQAFLTSIFWQ